MGRKTANTDPAILPDLMQSPSLGASSIYYVAMLHLIFRPLPPIGHHWNSEILYGVGMYRGEFEKDIGGSCNLRCERPKTAHGRPTKLVSLVGIS